MKKRAVVWLVMGLLLLLVATAFAADKAAKKAGRGNTLVDKTTGMEFVFVKGGCFQMGDIFRDDEAWEYPVHKVCVNNFYMGKYEVTQGQWKKVMGNYLSDFRDCGDDCPVEGVTWNDVQQFIPKLNESTGKKYRLPTEAEWEYAARSGGKHEKWAGTNSKAELGKYAWYEDNSGRKIHPIGQKLPNGLGLYDMTGNVREYCQDWDGEKYYSESPRNNPRGPDSVLFRVIRGGSSESSSGYSGTADRDRGVPDFRYYFTGFRIAASVR